MQVQQQMQGTSNVYELKLPVRDDGSYMRSDGQSFAAERIWLWEDPDFFAPFQGGARRLPNGNTFLTDTVNEYAREINPEGETVAEFFGSAPTYKAFKYSRAYVEDLLQ